MVTVPGELGVQHRLHQRPQDECVVGGDEMDRPPHHDDPDDPALRQVVGERLGTEPLEPGPEARVRVERHLRLQADDVLHRPDHVDLGAAQQELASQRRPAQRSSGQQPGTHAPAILAVADGLGHRARPHRRKLRR